MKNCNALDFDLKVFRHVKFWIKSLYSKTHVLLHFTVWKRHALVFSCSFEKYEFELKFYYVLDFELKKKQRVRFCINFLTTRQILIFENYTASDFECKKTTARQVFPTLLYCCCEPFVTIFLSLSQFKQLGEFFTGLQHGWGTHWLIKWLSCSQSFYIAEVYFFSLPCWSFPKPKIKLTFTPSYYNAELLSIWKHYWGNFCLITFFADLFSISVYCWRKLCLFTMLSFTLS